MEGFKKDKDDNDKGQKVEKVEDKEMEEAGNGVYMVLGNKFVVEKRYTIIDPIGSGAYGVVVAAKDEDMEMPDKKDGGDDEDEDDDDESNLVAIKKIGKAFEHRVFALRTYRELKIQRLLDHDNVLGIKRILMPLNKKEFDEIYVVSSLMETDLA